jgi:hypothetical protein
MQPQRRLVFGWVTASCLASVAVRCACVVSLTHVVCTHYPVTMRSYVLATGLIGYQLLNPLMDDNKRWMWGVQLLPAFSLYRCVGPISAGA